MDVHITLSKLGWQHGQTGGGCTAYTKETAEPSKSGGYPEGWYWMLTDALDPVAPTKPDQMVMIGLYDHNGTPIISFSTQLRLILDGYLVLNALYA